MLMHCINKMHQSLSLSIGIIKCKEIQRMERMAGKMFHYRHKLNSIKAVIHHIFKNIGSNLFHCSVSAVSSRKGFK